MDISELVIFIPRIIANAIENNQLLGYLVILFAMFLENLFPPIPSELIMPLAGFYVQQGQLQFVPVVIFGLVGTVLGAFPWYGLGRIVNEERIEDWLKRNGNWIGVKPQELSRSRRWFGKYGSALVFWGRLIPGVRTLISVPAGIELMPLMPFIIWTTAGSFLWNLLLTFAGFALGESYKNIGLWLEPVSSAIKTFLILFVVFGVIWIIFRFLRSQSKNYPE